jgi:hypothetical protein
MASNTKTQRTEEKERLIGGRKPVDQPVDQRSPNNQAMGGSDPEDYPSSGPLPVGEAPVHAMKKGQEGIPADTLGSENPASDSAENTTPKPQ